MPKLMFDSLEVIPEGLREHAAKDGEKFAIDVSPTAKVAEFRDNNIRLSQERDALKAQTEQITSLIGTSDLEKIKAEIADLRTTKQRVAAGELKTSAEVEAAAKTMSAAAIAELQAQLKAASDAKAAAEQAKIEADRRLGAEAIRASITQAAMSADSPVNAAALPDILSRADGIWVRAEDGSLIPKKNGVTIYSSKDGTSPMTPSEWLQQLVKDHPYFGKVSSGGGAGTKINSPNTAGLPKEVFDKMDPAARLNAWRRAQNRI